MSDLDREVIRRRRALGNEEADAADKWGLALSGGGIRSATFCLGLLRALAYQRLLLHFDLISSVSGGGYVAGMLGRLFCRATSAEDVRSIEAKLGGTESRWFLWWLRANGRYLVPGGMRDAVFAAAVFLRNLLGIHFELALIALLLGSVMAGFDLLLWRITESVGYQYPEWFFKNVAPYLSPRLPATWLFLVPAAFAAAVLMAAYWGLGLLTTLSSLAIALIVASAVALLSLALQHYDVLREWYGSGTLALTFLHIAIAVVGVWLLGAATGAMTLTRTAPGAREEQARSRLTRWLTAVLWAGLVIVAAGLVDRVAWYVAFESDTTAQLALVLALAAAVARAVMPLLAGLPKGTLGMGVLLLFGRILGYALTFFVCVWWVSLVQTAVFSAFFSTDGLDYRRALLVLALLGGPGLLYIVVTGYHVAFLNLSSLHGFFRARLARSYLGAANPGRFGEGSLAALGSVPPEKFAAAAPSDVNDVHPDDDVIFDAYRPQRFGGPVHLINVCVNQTRDPRRGLFNRDRRGLPLTIASANVAELSLRGWWSLSTRAPLTLASWLAISGAAIAPGLGRFTRGGVSALSTFAGLRMGYWWERNRTGKRTRWAPSFRKSTRLVQEILGDFPGDAAEEWFLTDGTHFENTGAYALLAERCKVIVLADCGADPKYQFEDLENLVRKARIDLQARILFQKPRNEMLRLESVRGDSAHESLPWLRYFGSLSELASDKSTACIALAKIEYNEASKPSKKTGVLIVLKPNLSDGVPMDLVNFKAKNRAFPQEATADQFFSEAQWESYFHLGEFLGGLLTDTLLRGLVTNLNLYFESDDRSPLDPGSHPAADTARGPVARLPARFRASAVSATLGAGAVATVGVAAWQAIDGLRTAHERRVSAERTALKELAEKWAEIPFADPTKGVSEVGALASALVHTADTLCPSGEAEWFKASELARNIHSTAVDSCRLLGQAPPACRTLLATIDSSEPGIPKCLASARFDLTLSRSAQPIYWVHDYDHTVSGPRPHPCDPITQKRRERAETLQGRIRLADEHERERTERCANYARLYVNIRAGTTPHSPLGTPPPKVEPDVPTLPPFVLTAPDKHEPQPSNGNGGASFGQAGAGSLDPDTAPPPFWSSEFPGWSVPGGAQQSAPQFPPSTAAPGAGTWSWKKPRGTSSASADTHAAPMRPTEEDCPGNRIYIQSYGVATAARLAYVLRQWDRLGKRLAPVEDILETARIAGRAAPAPIARHTIRTHDFDTSSEAATQRRDAARRCIDALIAATPEIDWIEQRLPAGLRPQRGAVEVWLAPQD